MRTNYNESSGRNGRYTKRQNGSNRRSSGRKSGNGSVNISGVTSKRNKYLDMAKEALSNGNRVEAENYYQHAEHYSKLLSAASATRREREESSESSNRRRNNNSVEAGKEEQVETAAPKQEEITDAKPDAAEASA